MTVITAARENMMATVIMKIKMVTMMGMTTQAIAKTQSPSPEGLCSARQEK